LLPAISTCSQFARNTYSNEGMVALACGTAPVMQRELLSVGSGYVLDWNHQNDEARLWSVGTDSAPLGSRPVRTSPPGPLDLYTVLVPLGGLSVAMVAPRNTYYGIAPVLTAPGSGNATGPPLGAAINGGTGFTWPDTNLAFAGYDMMALDGDYVIKWWLGTGDYVILHFDRQTSAATPLSLTSFAGTNPALRRGARLLNLGSNRLLEWIPITGTYRIWPYHFDGGAGEIFDPTPLADGHWDDPAPGDELLVVDLPDASQGRALLIWERATGRIRLRSLDPLALDPMSGAPIGDQVYPDLQSVDWQAPTQTRIRNIVVVLQSGRSFDSYFGQYCQAPFGSNPTCNQGPGCCEAMPASIPGASACTQLNPTVDDYVPNDSADCMLSKIDDSRMDAFATALAPAGCGDPRDFACAGVGPAAGAVAVYQDYAQGGALADRFFQSEVGPDGQQNAAYLSQASFRPPVKPQQLVDLAANARVRWALYLDDPMHVPPQMGYLPPSFYDPRWTFFRAPNEIQRDVELEQLPDISVVATLGPDSELPGQGPAARGIGFAKGIVDAVLASPRYAPSTLVIVGYLSSGGFYDHVSPPPAPPPFVDSQSSMSAPSGTAQVPYGPRLPLMALGPFARHGFVSHAPLELSSLTVFLEWNWLGEAAVGALGGRDRIAANIGSLLDPSATGEPVVPDQALLTYPPGLVWSNGFEGGDAVAWAQKIGDSGIESDGDARTGLSNGRLDAGNQVSSIAATVPVIDGYLCTAQAWIRASATVANASMQILDGSAAATTTIVGDPSGPPSYRPYALPFTAQGATATLAMRLQGDGQSGEFLDIDDVQIACVAPVTQN
jgi:hypothetical protein